MEIEPRGKYAGVKVHLDGEEAQKFLDFRKAVKKGYSVGSELVSYPAKFANDLGTKIEVLLQKHPNTLQDRTEEEIAAALQRDKDKIEKQQAAMKKGKDWKVVK